MYPLGASVKAEKGDADDGCPDGGQKSDAGDGCPEGGEKESVLQHNGFIIDTPGLRGFGLVDLEKEEIALYFPEMLRVGRKCFFTPCTHTHEPDCAVKEAIEKGEISPNAIIPIWECWKKMQVPLVK